MSNISIIVPVFQVESYLCRCIDSILNQFYTDYELILVDDGSVDCSSIICERYACVDKRIIVIHKTNGGLSDARNAGIDLVANCSDSDWISFVDSDDWIHPKFLEVLYRCAQTNKCEISTCYLHYTKGQNFVEDDFDTNTEVVSSEQYYCDFTSLAVSACEKIFKKELIEQLRFPKGVLHEDVFFTYKAVFAANQISVIKHELYAYFGTPDSIMRKKWSPGRLAAFDGFQKQLLFFQEKGYKKCYIRCIELIAETYCDQISQIQNELSVGIIDNKNYFRVLKRRLQKHLKQYAKVANLSIKRFPYFYAIAYPWWAKMYWIIDAQINKLRRQK